jgi:hypothetical protein
MRSQGIDMPDPSADGTMQAPGGNDKADAASKHCMSTIGNPPPPSAADQKSVNADMLKIAKCYRDNGVNVPDPTAGGGINIPADVPSDLLAKCGGHAGPMMPAQ